MSRPLYLVDSYAFIYRSYFAFVNRPLRNPSGANVSAAFGYFRFLFALFDERNPGAVAAVFDSKGKTFRHDMYCEYKATRQKTPEELIAQVPLVEEILGALGMPVLRMEGYEADDVIASLARRCAREGRECWIVSGDKDLLQLVGGSVKALRPGEGFAYRSFGVDEVKAEWGVGPERILDYLSLTGDASDNVPGVPGIGDKTALKLLLEYEGIDDIYARLDSVKPDGVKRKLEAGHESAMLSRKLITLADDLDTGIADLDSLAVDKLDFTEANGLFLREGMKSLVRGSGSGAVAGSAAPSGPSRSGTSTAPIFAARIKAKRDDGSPSLFEAPGIDGETIQEGRGLSGQSLRGRNGSPGEAETPESPAGDDPGDTGSARVSGRSQEASPRAGLDAELAGAGRYEAVTDRARLAAWVDFCIAAGACAFDCETDALDELSAELVGFSLCYVPKEACYVPVRSPDTPCIPVDETLAELRRLFASPALIIGHNIKYDHHIMRRSGAPITGRLFDTMIAAWVLDAESGGFGLEALAENRLGYTGVKFAEVVPKGSTFAAVPIADATRYAAEDADLTMRLYRLFSAELEAAGLERLFSTLEMPLVPILAAMEERGIAVRPDELKAYGIELETELERIRREIVALVGHEFNIASTKQLQDVLFIERKLPAGKKTKTGYSTDISVLEELAALDPVPAKILRHRMLAKLKSTYVDTLAELAEKEAAGPVGGEAERAGLPHGEEVRYGRVHTHYLQTGAATGRLASRDPNLQNIPIREEEGRRIREAFVAAPGKLLVSADYSQIELVVMAHLSGDPGLRAAFREGVDVHRRTASLLFNIPEDQVPADRRRIAKTINFGVIYGMSAFRLARDLGVSRTEAQSFIDAYFRTYSGVLDFIQSTIAETERSGYATTILGRRRLITAINSRNKTEKSGAERIAVNTPIQGSAADIVKLAMIRVDRAIRESRPEASLLLQVHDELILETPEGLVEETSVIVRREMENAMKLDIPLRVGIETARSWGEMH